MMYLTSAPSAKACHGELGNAMLSDEINQLLRNTNVQGALALNHQWVTQEPNNQQAWLSYARIHQQLSRFPDMLAAAQTAYNLSPDLLSTQKLLIEALVSNGEMALAKNYLRQFESALAQTAACDNLAEQWQLLVQLNTHCSDHISAVRCAENALAQRPNDPALKYNLAASLFATGDLARAESLLDEVIRQVPHDGDAWYLRSTLLKQTTQKNHIAELEQLLLQPHTPESVRVPLSYALGKECEDLGDYSRAFSAFSFAAQRRRQRLSYRVEHDVDTMANIAAAFDARCVSAAPAKTAVRHIFVVGLPRSGTTLVDRILCSHSDVGSLGEVNDLVFSLLRLVGHQSGKTKLIDAAAKADHKKIGDNYRYSSTGYGVDAKVLLDKTPLNFLYLGLIHLALPDARVVHLKRHPIDSCFAMYKTLFRMGYPFSYDWQDLAHYYAAYDRLMAHWRALIPQAFIDVEYEALVTQQETNSRRLLDYCELDWQPEVLAFQNNKRPTATASAAQVRQPLYRDSVAKWRHYESELQALKSALDAAGVSFEH